MAGAPHHRVGLRRVAWVRVSLGGDAPVAEAFGISHRLPRAHRVSLGTAADLVRRGAPLVVRQAPVGAAAVQADGTAVGTTRSAV